MLHELTIRNVAVIDALTVPFVAGLNVLTGETGAGKSILIDALQLVLGARSSEDLLRSEAAEAMVEAAFDPPAQPEALAQLEGEGIVVEPGEFLVLRRHLFRDGKSKAYVNGRLTSAGTLRTLADALVDIHGQHPGQPLLDPRRHREFLDAYAGLSGDVRLYRQTFQRWQEMRREQAELIRAERERARQQDFLAFQCREIEAANLTTDEEENLVAERAVLVNHERLFAAVEQAYGALEDADDAALDRLGSAAARVREGAAIDPRLAEAREALETGIVYLREAARSLRDYRGRIEFDPERLEAIEARLHEIEKLKRKYGGSLAEILASLERVRSDLALLGQSEARLKELDPLLGEALRDLTHRAEHLSKARGRAARQLQEAILGEIVELGMAKAVFEVQLASAPFVEDRLGPHGVDAVEFLISPNPGEALKPLHRIASGGELSRIMLAIRTILAGADQTPTLVFDEVDAGIGGSMAEVVGRKLVAASRRHQVLIVTHLPQIACFADHHVAVSKRMLRDTTQTAVEVLDQAGRGEELGRMLGGPSRSTTGRQHALELLEAANRLKKRVRATPSA